MPDKFYRVDTRFGQVRVTLTDADHVYVSLGESTNTPDGFTVCLNGCYYSGSLHMMRENGVWIPGRDPKQTRSPFTDRRAVYLNSRWDGKRFVEPTASACTKVLEVVLPAVAEWLEANPNALTEAHIVALENQFIKADEAMKEKREELEAAEREVTRLRHELAEVKHA